MLEAHPGTAAASPAPQNSLNAGEELARRAAARGSRAVYRWDGRATSGSELAERIAAFHGALSHGGIAPGERVLLLSRDTPAFAVAFLGALRAGVIPVPVSTLLSPHEVAFIARDAGARAVFVDAELSAAKGLAAAATQSADALAVVEPAEQLFGAFARAGRAAPKPAVTSADDPAFFLYTSGTTGKPKGVIHRHRDLAPTAELYARGVLGIGPEDRLFSTSPLYFAYGLGNSLTFPLWLGAEAVLIPQRATPDEVFRLLAAEQPTVLFSVPTLYARLLAHGGAPRALGRLRLCVSAGESLAPGLFASWRERFGLEIVDGLGSTEMLHIFLSNRPGACIPGSCGTLVPGYEVRLVDDTGSDVPEDSLGSLLAGGPSAAVGYWKQPDKTAQTMVAPGWLRTADTARRSAAGTYTLFGRSDDLFKVSGVYVSPDEIQAVLHEHPAVLETGVVDERDASGLARPCAFVVLREGWRADDALAAQLRQHVREHLAPYKAPQRILFCNEPLPRNAVGKLQRNALRKELS